MKDILIVGFGLAGLAVAKHAIDKNLSFDIITDHSQKSSKVAGGIINPVAVKRMKPVWKVEYFLDYAKFYYKSWGQVLGIPFYKDISLQVYIHNTEQENNWFEACDKPRLKPFLLPKLKAVPASSLNTHKLGLIQAGLVHLSELFSAAEKYYKSQNILSFDSFQYDKIDVVKHGIQYNNKSYKHIIFCEGFGVTHNPYFNNLGIYGNKGDYLIVKSDKLKQENLCKAKYFLIPLGNDLYKFGATYQRQPLDHETSEDAKLQMIEALEKMIKVPYKLVDQVCGIRPTTKDRKPILGSHQTHKNLHILNGFGSRGVMTSPLLGKNLLEYIFEGKTLNPEVSIQRIYAQT